MVPDDPTVIAMTRLGYVKRMDVEQFRKIVMLAQGEFREFLKANSDKKNEILYTDSWGAGHELKRMPVDWAWTITHSLMYMKPLSK